MAVASDRVTATAIEATEFPELSRAYQVMGVPKIVINDRVEFEGALPEPEFLERRAAGGVNARLGRSDRRRRSSRPVSPGRSSIARGLRRAPSARLRSALGCRGAAATPRGLTRLARCHGGRGRPARPAVRLRDAHARLRAARVLAGRDSVGPGQVRGRCSIWAVSGARRRARRGERRGVSARYAGTSPASIAQEGYNFERRRRRIVMRAMAAACAHGSTATAARAGARALSLSGDYRRARPPRVGPPRTAAVGRARRRSTRIHPGGFHGDDRRRAGQGGPGAPDPSAPPPDRQRRADDLRARPRRHGAPTSAATSTSTGSPGCGTSTSATAAPSWPRRRRRR